MIKLINGRGQLGEAISSKLDSLSISPYQNSRLFNCDTLIYHTWNIQDKSEAVQSGLFEEFVDIVNNNKESQILFTSTYSQQEDWYVYYKQSAEAYLLNNCKRGLVLRFPTLIGKGVLPKLKNGKATPHGIMELMSIDTAADHVIDKINYSGKVRSFYFAGEKILAKTAQQILIL